MPSTLDADQVTSLLSLKGNDFLTIRDRAILELFYSSGLRLSEVVGLDLLDIDLDDRVVRVLGKGNKIRIVPVGKYAIRAIKEWLIKREIVKMKKEKALFINEAHSSQFSTLTLEESTPLLEFLFRHQIKSEFTCRFKWEKGSVAIWDNRCTLHNPINDYHGKRRLMHRITFSGDTPV